MFSFFKKSPADKLRKKIAARYEDAVSLQRNGKLREYGALMAEIDQMETELAALTAA